VKQYPRGHSASVVHDMSSPCGIGIVTSMVGAGALASRRAGTSSPEITTT
jgi:hypothetical protein